MEYVLGKGQDDMFELKMENTFTFPKRIDSFESNDVDTYYYKTKYLRNNGLDGKVSRLVVKSYSIFDGRVAFYEGDNLENNLVSTHNT